MSIFRGLGNRGGNRGGKDQFNWDDVRGDKYKEYYLGQSLKIQGGDWWSSGKLLATASAREIADMVPSKSQMRKKDRAALAEKLRQQQLLIQREEILRVQRQEQEQMMETLGLAPKKKRESGKTLEKHELKELTARGATERDATDIERVGGLGFEPAPSVKPAEDLQFLPRTEYSGESMGLVHVDDYKKSSHSDDGGSKKEKKHKKEKKLKDKKEKKHKKRKDRSDDEHTSKKRRR